MRGVRLMLPLVATALLAQACGETNRLADLIAFPSFRDGTHDIYVVALDGRPVRRLASNISGDPVWSPDGQRIAFFRDRSETRPACRACIDLYVMEANGSGKRRLTSFSGGYGDPSWSPDGSMIAFDRCYGGIDAGKDSCAVYVIQPDGSGLRRVTPEGVDGEPVWSPDGKRIAFDGSVSKENGIHVIAADGSGLQRLTAKLDTNPRWSPDGSKIVFERMTPLASRDARIDIYAIAPDGKGLSRLTRRAIKKAYEPIWSPDGSRIAFVGQRERSGLCPPVDAIYTIAPDGSAQQRLTSYRPMYGYPTWSPDGKHIAFESVTHQDCMSANLDWRIYVMTAEGAGVKRLAAGAVSELGLSWQPTRR